MPPRDMPLPESELELDAGDRTLGISLGREILIVDDNPTNLIAIEAALGPLGCPLVLARSGVEALARLLDMDFALILLDVTMPDLDGFETARLVRSRTRNRHTPIIFVKGMAWQDDEVIRGYELGGFDFLMKPIRPEVLRAKASVFVQLQERTIELHQKAEELRLAQIAAHERELVAQRRRFETSAMERQVAVMSENDRRKDEFLAILAHELRNPLQPLQTALEVMGHDPDRPVPPRLRNIVQRQVTHITRLVDDLLDISRFTAGKLELRRTPTAMAEMIDEAIIACRPLIDQRHHTLELSTDGTNPMVFGDPIRLVQVLVNIISNAAKYTPERGTIEVGLGTRDTSAFVTISDNGRGITPELLPTIFDMFVQERTSPDGAGGLGLGLGLVKRLVELHHGTVRAESAGVGLGSAFEIAIPLVDAPVQTEGERVAAKRRRERPLRIVVVDDAPDLRELLAELLRLRGHEVTTAATGGDGVEAVMRLEPDVALVDIGLPDMDGHEVARRVRANLGASAPRLIAITGYGQERDRANALAAGFDAHIVKPVTSDGILEVLFGTNEAS